MTTYQSGRESEMLDAIIAGTKTIEGRLNRGKFAKYKIGDFIWLRRDFRDQNGLLQDGPAKQAKVKITGIHKYGSFRELLEKEDLDAVLPNVKDINQACNIYKQYYSIADQNKYGVLAIKIKLTSLSKLNDRS